MRQRKMGFTMGSDTTPGYDPLKVLRREKFRDWYRANNGPEKAARLNLISSQGHEELLHLGRWGLKARHLAIQLVFGQRVLVALPFVVCQGFLQRSAPAKSSVNCLG